MDNSRHNIDVFNDTDDSFDLKQEIGRYFKYWPFFLLAVLIALMSAYIYLRYASPVYETYSKVKILDESDGLELPTSAFIFKRSNINLENETEILTSYLILERVVKTLKLNTRFYEEGTIQTSQLQQLPFYFEQIIASDSIQKNLSYQIDITKDGFEVQNTITENVFSFPDFTTLDVEHRLPFNITLSEIDLKSEYLDKTYIIKFVPLKNTALSLKSQIIVESIGEQSDILKLSMKGQNRALSESVLETLMQVFNQDGISDRQLVSKRTIKFITDRFLFLEQELDSIEISYQDFKQNNNLVDLATDVSLGLEQKAQSEAEVFKINNQLELAKLLKKALLQPQDSELLPENIGIENAGVNSLISNYNSAVNTKNRMTSSGGINNPAVRLAIKEVENLKTNIKRSLESYIRQLESSQLQLGTRNNQFAGKVAQIPEKERLLKSISRQQKIKQSLYILLLQKREEAAINLAITEPSIKIVDIPLSGVAPISPKSTVIYVGALSGGLLIPFGILYMMFMLDTKLHGKEDIIKLTSKIPVVGEIPEISKKENLMFSNPNDRSVLAESFRILSANVNYMLPNFEDSNNGQVVYCTSTIKGEGKTYISINLSLALSSLNKKVLLIGADLRNPQIHSEINLDKDQPGLSNYLHESSFDWKNHLVKGFDKHSYHDILLSGTIPPNPTSLLTNGRFEALIDEARGLYDYIVVDTAPTILVTDTMLISHLADATIYIARANVTEKKLLNFSKDLEESGKLKNMAYVLNGLGHNKSYGYNYGYNYGYGSDN